MLRRLSWWQRMLISPLVAVLGLTVIVVMVGTHVARTRSAADRVAGGLLQEARSLSRAELEVTALAAMLEEADGPAGNVALAAADRRIASLRKALDGLASSEPERGAGLRATAAAEAAAARDALVRGPAPGAAAGLETIRAELANRRNRADQRVAVELGNLRSDTSALRWWVVGIAGLTALLIGGATLVGIWVLADIIVRTRATVERMAAGDLTLELEIVQTDEIGNLGIMLNQFFATIRGAMAIISIHAAELGEASQSLGGVSRDMRGHASDTSSQASLSSASADQVSVSVQTVATAVEELSASIAEIAASASHAARTASTAVDRAQAANSTIASLESSSSEIGKVSQVISSIAEQTNLLALNATIEAARAGEAGRGFAVVANEVKELARESATATEDIRRRIEAIQQDSRKAIESIAEISGIVTTIHDIQATIAAAVDQQTATTAEIGRNITEAAIGSSEIAAGVTGVAQAAEGTTRGAEAILSAAAALAEMSAELQRTVGQFRFDTGGDAR